MVKEAKYSHQVTRAQKVPQKILISKSLNLNN